MREYGKVHSSFWSSQTIRDLSDDGKMLALYLMTSPHTTIAGVFRLPDGYACEDLGWTAGRLAKGFAELFAKGFANRCETTKWVWIVKHLDWNPPENPNQRKAATKIAMSVPAECSWKRAFMRVCGQLLGFDAGEETNPCETVQQPLLNQEQEQEQEQKKNTSSGKPDRKALPGFVRFWAAWPKSDRKVAKAACETRWRSRGLEEDADRIVAHVESMRSSKQWRDGYDPAPLTYLNQRRWEDSEGTPKADGAGWWIRAGYGDEAMARAAGLSPDGPADDEKQPRSRVSVLGGTDTSAEQKNGSNGLFSHAEVAA